MPPPVNYLSFSEMFYIISLSGLFGGIVSSIFDILKATTVKDSNENLISFNYENPIILIFCKALIGVAGAFGIIFLGIWLKKITTEATVINQIFLVGLSITSGTISYRVLPGIGSKLEEQFLEKKIAKNEQKIEETEKKVIDLSESALEYTAAIAHAETAMSRDGYEHDAQQAIPRLENLSPLFPCDRTLHIILGRLYKKNEDYNNAILTLRKYINNIEEHKIKRGISNSQHDIDRSDAYFNIACYHALKANELGTGASIQEIERLKGEAIDALNTSINLWAQNKQYAQEDPDLNFIKSDDRYTELVEK